MEEKVIALLLYFMVCWVGQKCHSRKHQNLTKI